MRLSCVYAQSPTHIAGHGDMNMVNRRRKRHLWPGQTGQELLDSAGTPASIESRSTATRIREVWNYDSISKDRCELGILFAAYSSDHRRILANLLKFAGKRGAAVLLFCASEVPHVHTPGTPR